MLGTAGKHSGNIVKELRTFLGKCLTPEPQQFSIRCRNPKPIARHGSVLAVKDVLLKFLCPHVLFSDLWRHHREEFCTVLLGGATEAESKCEVFWTNIIDRRDPRVRYHPMCERQDWEKRAIPISIPIAIANTVATIIMVFAVVAAVAVFHDVIGV